MARSRSRRGEYRAIHTVLVDGPDYQALTPHARLLLLTVKLSLGPCQIGVMPALHATLEERTGLSAADVDQAVAELEHRGWLEVERNVVWVVRGLEYEPSLNAENQKHRAGVKAYVMGIPRLSIVGRFLARYATQWGLDDLADSHAHAMPMPIACTDTETETETDSSASVDAESAGWSTRAVALARAVALPYAPGRCTRILKPFVERDGADVALGHWQVFLESGRHFDPQGKYLPSPGPMTLLRPERFRDSYADWKPSPRSSAA